MFVFFKQKTAYEMLRSLVGSEMCIRDRAAHGGFVFQFGQVVKAAGMEGFDGRAQGLGYLAGGCNR